MSIMSKAHKLHELLAEGSELDIVCHNNPDPDCLASALAASFAYSSDLQW